MLKIDVDNQARRFGGGGGGGFRLPSRKNGIVLLIIVLVAGYYGVDLTGMLTGEPMRNSRPPRSIHQPRR